jgi:hypothetical protein
VRPTSRTLIPWALSCAVLAFTSSARADGPYEGDWRRGAMSISVSVATWGSDCGARPESTTVPARGTVHVTQEGDHLTFGGGRSTRTCWSDNPAVRRVSSTFSSGTWRVVCRSPADDSRQETGTYTLHAAGTDTIEFRDVTEYDWTLNESRCRATSTTTQTFTRVSGGAVAEPTPTPTIEPEPSPACVAGAAARIALRPASTDVEPGGRACFTARVVDASGCPLGTNASLALRAPEGRAGALRGTCFEAASTGGEGEFTILATSGALSAEARVRVHTMDLSDLIARRAESGDVASDPGVATTDTAAGVAARTEAAPAAFPWWAVALAAFGVLIVIVSAIVLLTRSRARTQKLAHREHAVSMVPMPSRDLANASSGTSSDLVGPTVAAPPPEMSPPAPVTSGDAQAKICPTCRRGYAANERTCKTDGTELVAYTAFVQKSEAIARSVCPKCGTRYTGTTRFCGKDGETLVPVS